MLNPLGLIDSRLGYPLESKQIVLEYYEVYWAQLAVPYLHLWVLVDDLLHQLLRCLLLFLRGHLHVDVHEPWRFGHRLLPTKVERLLFHHGHWWLLHRLHSGWLLWGLLRGVLLLA